MTAREAALNMEANFLSARSKVDREVWIAFLSSMGTRRCIPVAEPRAARQGADLCFTHSAAGGSSRACFMDGIKTCGGEGGGAARRVAGCRRA